MLQRKNVASLEEGAEEMYEYQTDPEDCSKRDDLRIDRVLEQNGESWEDSDQKV